MTIHLILEMKQGVVTTACGELSTTEFSTVWWRDVTCNQCIPQVETAPKDPKRPSRVVIRQRHD